MHEDRLARFTAKLEKRPAEPDLSKADTMRSGQLPADFGGLL
jgi:hypothetical protein